MSFSHVQSALMTRLEAVNAGLTGGPFPIAYPNVEFTVPDDAPWIQVFLFTNQPFVGSLGPEGEDEISGILQLDVYVPLGEGTGRLTSLFDSIRSGFKAGTQLTYSGQWALILSCGMRSPMKEDGFYRGTVTIEWETRISRA